MTDGPDRRVALVANARFYVGPDIARGLASRGHFLRNVVPVMVVGTNFMDFPEFLRASGATDPDVRARIEQQVPMHRLGTVEECAALCRTFLDGARRFVTGQFVAHDGGGS